MLQLRFNRLGNDADYRTTLEFRKYVKSLCLRHWQTDKLDFRTIDWIVRPTSLYTIVITVAMRQHNVFLTAPRTLQASWNKVFERRKLRIELELAIAIYIHMIERHLLKTPVTDTVLLVKQLTTKLPIEQCLFAGATAKVFFDCNVCAPHVFTSLEKSKLSWKPQGDSNPRFQLRYR